MSHHFLPLLFFECLLFFFIFFLISKFGADFLDFECCEFAKSHFELQLFFHFWNVNIVFSIGWLVGPFNGFLTFFIFIVYCLRSFLYKGMLLPSFTTEVQAQPSIFFSYFPDFLKKFFFLYIRAMRPFPWHFFFLCCLFCFVAHFPWSLGFDIKLYTVVLMFAFIWWLCISLIATFLQWRMPSCYYILFLQQ